MGKAGFEAVLEHVEEEEVSLHCATLDLLEDEFVIVTFFVDCSLKSGEMVARDTDEISSLSTQLLQFSFCNNNFVGGGGGRGRRGRGRSGGGARNVGAGMGR